MNIKARISQKDGIYYIETAGQLPKACSQEDVKQFLLKYSQVSDTPADTFVDTAPVGNIVAYVNDNDEFVFTSPHAFSALFSTNTEYITVVEYAARYGKQRSIITRFCREGRIPGAYQKGHCWFVPADAPYPKHGHIKNY